MAEAQQRGMGRGLAAILPRSGKVEDGLREIPPDLIQPNARQPRTPFDHSTKLQLVNETAPVPPMRSVSALTP